MFGGFCAKYNTALTQIRLTHEGGVPCEYANNVAHLALARSAPPFVFENGGGGSQQKKKNSPCPCSRRGQAVSGRGATSFSSWNPQALAALIGDRTAEEGEERAGREL